MKNNKVRMVKLLLITAFALMLPGHVLAAAKMYFTEAGPTNFNLQRANPDGTSLETVVADDGVNVHREVVVDTSTATLYFIDSRASGTPPGIYKVDLAGPFPTIPTLVIAVPSIKGLAIDQTNGHLYYGETANYNLYRCNTDGSNATLVVPDDGAWSPADLWLDDASGTLFIANISGALEGIVKVAVASLPVTSTASLVSVLGTTDSPTSISGYQGKIYYNNFNPADFNLYRINFDGTGAEVVIPDDGLWSPGALYVDDATGTLYLSDTANTNSIRKVAVTALPTATTGAAALSLVIAKKAAGILVVSPNTPPAIANLNGDTLSYSEGAGALVIDQGTAATVTDSDSADFDTGTLTISVASGRDGAEDVLAIRNQGTGAGQIGVSGSNVTYGGTTIGTFSGGTGTSDLVITFNANSTLTAVQALIRNISYENTDTASPTTGSRSVTFILTDGDGGTATTQTTTVSVSGVNDAPVITSNGGGASASTAVNENSTAVTTVTATDVDSGDTLSYSISGGADAARFSINSSTGALVFASAPNYESPADSGANNVYDVQVTVTDNGSGTLTDVQAIAVTVNNINENPVITSNGGGATASVNAAENQTSVTTVTAVDQDITDTLTYSISGGADQALFSINSASGVLTFASAPNYESPTDSGANGVYDVQVTATDNGAGTLTDVQAIAVTVTNANDAPVITSNGGGASASTAVNENSTAVTTVTATDVDSGDTLSYSISGGADAARFSINSSTGALVFASAPNYELPIDSGANNVYDVQVTVTDNGSGTLTDVQAIAVTVNNINENPVITSNGGGATASVNAAENQTAVTTVTASDQDSADTLTYSISGGADQALFSINSSTGVLAFASAPNYESPTDSGANGVYDVQVTVTDNGAGTLTDVQAIAVTVTNANESPVITSNGGGATASTSVNENSTAVTTVTATDVDTVDTLTYSISGGADAARFSINSSTGALVFASAPNYELPIDSGANNVYDVQVTVTDNGSGTLTDVQAIAVTVNNINENPVITSNGGGATASVNAAENQTAVTTVTASDQDSADTLTYSISGGADQALFTINSASGVLAFASAPNYESPTDSGANNVYDVQVTATDNGTGNLTDVQAIAVTVTNVNDAPAITSNGGGASASVNAAENQSAVTTVTAIDQDTADTLTYSISGGADQALFTINSASGVLGFASAPDYESPADSGANNVYDVQVTVTDNGAGNLTDVQAIAVSVTNVNETPAISGTPSTTSPPDTVLFSFIPTASDPDAGSTLTYSINSTPTWATFNTSTGELSGTPAPGDIGTTTSNIIISVSDGALSASLAPFSLTVVAGNHAPTISGTPATSVAGHTAYSFTPAAGDADGDPLTFSIVNKPAWASFSTTTGELAGTPINSDAGTTSGITISVSDGTASASLATFDLTVTENLDIDGDGMPNDWETAHGLDPFDPTDADADPDGDGLTNLEEYLANKDPAADDNPPMVSVPTEVTVDAVGLFTPVTLGSASAVDALDGVVPTTNDAPAYFAPGVHTVTWSATDAAGNTGTATQTVNVVPLVSFSKDQTAAEGGAVTFRVILNGPVVSYPVTVPYTLSGTAATDGSDHDLLDGVAVIASGLETSINFNTVNDGAGEGTEQIVISMGSPSNAVTGIPSTHTVDLVEGNVAPMVSLSADQGTGVTRIVVTGNGLVTVGSAVRDPNSGDSHSYDWSASDNALLDSDGAPDTFSFDPSTLSPGIYTLRLTVSDGAASNDAQLSLDVRGSAPSLSPVADTDGDGIDDATEGYGDSDSDGVADYLDAIDSANVLQANSGVSSQYLLESEPGLRLALGAVAFRSGAGQVGVSMSDVENYGDVTPDSGYQYSGMLFDFIVDQLVDAGQSVDVVLPLQAAVPANAVYRKVVNGLWQDFVVDAHNRIASAPGAPGYCPPPGDSAYTAGLTEGNWCVQLTIEDGGPNDADGLANNSVADPGGVAVRLAQPVTVRVDSGGGATTPWLLLLLGLLLWRTRLLNREEA